MPPPYPHCFLSLLLLTGCAADDHVCRKNPPAVRIKGVYSVDRVAAEMT